MFEPKQSHCSSKWILLLEAPVAKVIFRITYYNVTMKFDAVLVKYIHEKAFNLQVFVTLKFFLLLFSPNLNSTNFGEVYGDLNEKYVFVEILQMFLSNLCHFQGQLIPMFCISCDICPMSKTYVHVDTCIWLLHTCALTLLHLKFSDSLLCEMLDSEHKGHKLIS